MLSLPGPAVPQLIVKEGIDPSKLFINGTTSAPPPPPPPNELCGQFESLKQKHQELVMQQITINEFFKVIADSIFTFLSNSNNKKKIGEVNSNALNLLLISLSGKVSEYNSAEDIGDDTRTNIILKECMNIIFKVMNKLDKICV